MRRGGLLKRGAGAENVPIELLGGDVAGDRSFEPVNAIFLDRALTRLEALDPDAARVVELRFFGGLTIEETAEVVGHSPSSIKREWAAARAWLYRQMATDPVQAQSRSE